MKKILLISVTAGNNLILAEKIKQLMNLDSEIITLEDYKLPLYDGKAVVEDKTIIDDLCKKIISVDGFIFCGPEYNGGSAPTLTNAISWISGFVVWTYIRSFDIRLFVPSGCWRFLLLSIAQNWYDMTGNSAEGASIV